MGWYDDVTGWMQGVWVKIDIRVTTKWTQNKSELQATVHAAVESAIWPAMKDAAVSTIDYSFETLSHLWMQMGVAPRVVRSAVTHLPLRKVEGMLLTTMKAWAPLMVLSVAYGATDSYLQHCEQNAGFLDNWLASGLRTGAWASRYIVLGAWCVTSFRQRLKMNVRSLVVSSALPGALTELSLRDEITVCRNSPGYDFCLLPEEKDFKREDFVPEYGKIYFRNDKGNIRYTLMTPKGQIVRDQLLPDMEVPYPFTARKLDEMREPILKYTTSKKRRHTLEVDSCTSMRKIKGILLMDPAIYLTSILTFDLLDFLVPSLSPVVFLLRLFQNGRYVLDESMGSVCYRHKKIYHREYPELSLAMGLGQWLGVKGISLLLTSLTGIPDSSYRTALEQLMLVGFVALATHMQLPRAVHTSRRSLILDPFAVWQAGLGTAVEITAYGTKVVISRAIQESKRYPDPTGITPQQVMDRALWVAQSRPAQAVRWLLLPRFLQSWRAFMEDPVIRQVWPGIREGHLQFFKTIEDVQQNLIVQIMIRKPKEFAFLVSMIIGRRAAIEFFLKLFGNENFMQKVGDLRRWFEGMQLETPLTLEPFSLRTPLQLGQTDAIGSVAPFPVLGGLPSQSDLAAVSQWQEGSQRPSLMTFLPANIPATTPAETSETPKEPESTVSVGSLPPEEISALTSTPASPPSVSSSPSTVILATRGRGGFFAPPGRGALPSLADLHRVQDTIAAGRGCGMSPASE